MNHLSRDMEELIEATFKMAALVEEMLRGAIRSLCDAGADLAGHVVAADADIDRIPDTPTDRRRAR